MKLKKYIQGDNQLLEAQFFYEFNCPICRYVLYHVMYPMQTEGYFRLRLFEIKANKSSLEITWFNNYSEIEKEALTPTIRLVDRHLVDTIFKEYPYRVFHLWEEKEDEVTESDEITALKLREQLIDACEKYKKPIFENYHNIKNKFKILPQRGDKLLVNMNF